MYYSDDADKYFEDIDEFIVEYLENYDEEVVVLDDLPTYINGCKAQHPVFDTAIDVAEKILEDIETRKTGKLHFLQYADNAESLIESLEEDFYNGCDDDGPFPGWNGIEELQDALDLFTEINTFIWLAFSRFKWYQPKYSLGLKALDRALKKCEADNQHHTLYYLDRKQEIAIDREDWIEALSDLGLEYAESNAGIRSQNY